MRARAVAERIEAGMVSVNTVTTRSPELPFGGVKRSGYGRELSDLGMHEFANPKLIRTLPARNGVAAPDREPAPRDRAARRRGARS